MREIRLSGSEGGGANPIVSPYPYHGHRGSRILSEFCELCALCVVRT